MTLLSESFYRSPVAIKPHSLTIGATPGQFPCATVDIMLMTLPCSFFQDAHRITSKEYIPSNADILHAPVLVHEMGTAETCLSMGRLFIRLHVVTRLGCGGERKKWIHFFENITSILFCSSLLDYDKWENGQGRI
jgi:hypothetical protein